MQNKHQAVEFWLSSSDRDHKTMKALFSTKRYYAALFFGQLLLEKTLKAIYINKKDTTPPFTHDLVLLATHCNLPINDERKKDLEDIGGFHINARYDDYKYEFYKKATKSFTQKYIKIIEENKKWLKKQI